MNPNAKHTQSKATPGPWAAYNATGNAGRILKRWIVEAPTKKICTVDDQPADATAATAALIAAAPALLEALKSAVSYLEANRPKGNIREIFTQLNEYENGVLKPARAAIAQAEGGAQ